MASIDDIPVSLIAVPSEAMVVGAIRPRIHHGDHLVLHMLRQTQLMPVPCDPSFADGPDTVRTMHFPIETLSSLEPIHYPANSDLARDFGGTVPCQREGIRNLHAARTEYVFRYLIMTTTAEDMNNLHNLPSFTPMLFSYARSSAGGSYERMSRRVFTRPRTEPPATQEPRPKITGVRKLDI